MQKGRSTSAISPSILRKNGRILKLSPESGTVKVHCKDSGKSNGLFFDPSGNLIAACGANGGLRAIVEIKPDGTVVVKQSKFDGKQFNYTQRPRHRQAG